MALKASGSAYRSCNPCTGAAMMMTPQQQLQKSNDVESDLSTSVSERFRWSYRRNGSKNSSSDRVWGKEMEARLKGISMGNGGGGGDVSVGILSVERQLLLEKSWNYRNLT
ncbi:hypothetical protein L6452_06326 [Arctium lappa]|uniref:Uncharacterized protein n=1 Tax=Arctium lappa TaxID=4217 RepID=A0ACB9EIE3_ARCLA|nr:hypothetical protein L6452_06326 [Arctium lappa]